MPPLPTSPLPTSNCGLISITNCVDGPAEEPASAGRIRVTEMKLTSQTIRSTGLADRLRLEVAGVDAFVNDDARIVAELPIELAGADIDGVDAARRRAAAGNR